MQSHLDTSIHRFADAAGRNYDPPGLFAYLRTCSRNALESFHLSRLAEKANAQQKIERQMEALAEIEAELLVVGWARRQISLQTSRKSGRLLLTAKVGQSKRKR